jgi:TetR/AcrR family transcriptional repressor of mexJK operon
MTVNRTKPAPKPFPGRASKRHEILDAAVALFMRNGFAGTSIDEIATAADVSRQTIYNNFKSKEQLFRALAERFVEQTVGPLLDPAIADADLDATLRDLASRWLSLVLQPSSLALHRLVISEGQQFPELMRQLYDVGARRTLVHLASFLEEQTRRGKLAVADPMAAAEQFFGMLVGHRQIRALLGFADDGQPEKIKQAAAATTATFLRAFRK